MAHFLGTNKKQQSIRVIRKTEVTFMMIQIKMETFLRNQTNYIRIYYALIVYQA